MSMYNTPVQCAVVLIYTNCCCAQNDWRDLPIDVQRGSWCDEGEFYRYHVLLKTGTNNTLVALVRPERLCSYLALHLFPPSPTGAYIACSISNNQHLSKSTPIQFICA